MTKAFKFFTTAFGQILILLAVSGNSYSQSTIKIKYGDLDTNRISVEEFINQKGLKVSTGFVVDSAFAYFSIPGQNAVRIVNYFPKIDTAKFNKYSRQLIPGATVIFKVFVTDIVNHKSFPVQLSYMFYSMTKGNISYSSPQYLEWKKLRETNYLSGTIYFSGTYFENVVAFRIQQGKLDELKKLFDRCAIGTTITFDNVSYTDEKGILITRNDSFKL